jgi:uncharacterized protein YukE
MHSPAKYNGVILGLIQSRSANVNGHRHAVHGRLRRPQVRCSPPEPGMPRNPGGMPLLPDTSAMRTTAVRLIHEADHLHNAAAAVRAYTGQVRWRGPAALAFQDQAEGICASLAGASRSLIAAATALREHAANVDSAVFRLTTLAPGLVDPLGLVHHGGLLDGRPLRDVVRGVESVTSGAIRTLENVLPW